MFFFLTFSFFFMLCQSAAPNDGDFCTSQPVRAGEPGYRQWCWHDLQIPAGYENKVNFADNSMGTGEECNNGQVVLEGNTVHHMLNPVDPPPQSWCNNAYNMRAEVFTRPWPAENLVPTEQWWGWRYTFGADYVIDQKSKWLFFQVHPGEHAPEAPSGLSPQLAITVSEKISVWDAGELLVIVSPQGPETRIKRTRIVPVAGQSLDIVVQVVWAVNGTLRVWIDGDLVRHDQGLPNVYDHSPWGGNAKWGIYKSPWRSQAGAQSFVDQGLPTMHTYTGPVRSIVRLPSDPNYLRDEYETVKPRGRTATTSSSTTGTTPVASSTASGTPATTTDCTTYTVPMDGWTFYPLSVGLSSANEDDWRLQFTVEPSVDSMDFVMSLGSPAESVGNPSDFSVFACTFYTSKQGIWWLYNSTGYAHDGDPLTVVPATVYQIDVRASVVRKQCTVHVNGQLLGANYGWRNTEPSGSLSVLGVYGTGNGDSGSTRVCNVHAGTGLDVEEQTTTNDLDSSASSHGPWILPLILLLFCSSFQAV